ncbi:D-alanyl-D-alanine carboxypeptidase, partial [Kibdelosporangium lantanae]
AANNLHGKTGSMTGVSALSGYVTSADGQPLVFSMISNNFPGSAKATAQTAVDGMNSKDVDALKKVSCDKESVGADNPFTDPSKMPPGLTFKANLGDVQETGDKATAKVTMDITYMGVNQSIPLTFSLKKNGSDWCIDDASMSKGTPGGN